MMVYEYSENLWRILACPYCGRELRRSATGVVCLGCGTEYCRSKTGVLDLRLRQEKSCKLEFVLPGAPVAQADCDFRPLMPDPRPAVDFSGIRTPLRITRELMSYFPRAGAEDSLALDLGCGGMLHREICEQAGYEYVGLDYVSPKAMLLGDAHALPFQDNSFEFALCLSVLEHIRFPFVMTREAHRVLKPGGTFIGSVAFLEPYHEQSFYHHTHLGLCNMLGYPGFTLEQVGVERDWSGLAAQATMGLFPRMPRRLARSLVWPLEMLHVLWWRLGNVLTGKGSEAIRQRNTAGAFVFVAHKGVQTEVM